MRIVFSKSYLKWKKANKNPRAAEAVEDLLIRVYRATDITQVSPRPKSVGNNLRKTTGTVDEYTLNKQFRVYAKCAELTPGLVSFCVANVGIKGNTNQTGDILASLDIFDDIDGVEWTEWKPTPEQLAKFAVDDANDDMADDEEPVAPVVPTKSASKKKGKPLDENGMTVAERKALQKKQKQQEQQQRAAAKKKAKESATQTHQDVSVPSTVASNAPADQTVANNTPIPVTPDKVLDKADVDDDIGDNEIRVIEPTPISVSVEFKDYADAQYHLEMIEQQMKIEQLKIRMIQHEIALAELTKKKLLLLQLQKMKDLQK